MQKLTVEWKKAWNFKLKRIVEVGTRVQHTAAWFVNHSHVVVRDRGDAGGGGAGEDLAPALLLPGAFWAASNCFYIIAHIGPVK